MSTAMAGPNGTAPRLSPRRRSLAPKKPLRTRGEFPGLGLPVKVYRYEELTLEVCRFEPKDFRQRHADPAEPGLVHLEHRWLRNRALQAAGAAQGDRGGRMGAHRRGREGRRDRPDHRHHRHLQPDGREQVDGRVRAALQGRADLRPARQ